MAPLKTSTTRNQWGATVTVAFLVRCNAVARVWNKFWADGMQGFRSDFVWLRWFGCCPRNSTRLVLCSCLKGKVGMPVLGTSLLLVWLF